MTKASTTKAGTIRDEYWPWVTLACLLFANPLLAQSSSPAGPWESNLRNAFFADRPIVEDDDVISLEAPGRAENAAIVPIRIRAGFAQTPARYIESITLIIDKNPAPLGGVFRFTRRSGRADLALRIRVNAYTNVRAIAETNDGSLHMSTRFVKASGGCSAPVGTDLDAAMARLGKMKLRTQTQPDATQPLLAQLAISHPNITGLQMDQVTHLYMPPHFVRKVSVTFNAEPVFDAQTDISISENPNFRFYFMPSENGELVAEIEDTDGSIYTKSHRVLSQVADAAQ